MKKINIIAIIFSLMCMQSLKAEGYAGIDYLYSKVDTGVTNISSNLDEDDNGYSLYIGSDLNENVALEVSYNDFGEASLSGVSGNQFKVNGTTFQFNTTATLSSSAKSWGFAAKPKVTIADGVSAYGKIGLHRWTSTFSITGTTTTASADDSGTDIFYGAGIEIGKSNLKGRAGYSIYNLDGEDVTTINLGLAYSF
jgi:hypothetical protein